MKTIKYADYKKNENNYVKINGTYNNEDKTIQIKDRLVYEFDLKILDVFENLHLKFICKDISNENILLYYYNLEEHNCKGLFFDSDMISVSSDFIEFYINNKETLDAIIISNGIFKYKVKFDIKENCIMININDDMNTRKKIKAFRIIKNIFMQIEDKFNIEYKNFLEMIENNKEEIFNINIYDPDK